MFLDPAAGESGFPAPLRSCGPRGRRGCVLRPPLTASPLPLAAVSTSVFIVAVLVLLLLLYRRDPTCCQFLCSCRFFQSPGPCVSAPCPRAGLCRGGNAAAPLGGPGRAFLLPSLPSFGTWACGAPRCSALWGRGPGGTVPGSGVFGRRGLCAVPGKGAAPSDAGTAVRKRSGHREKGAGAERRLPLCPGWEGSRRAAGRWVPRCPSAPRAAPRSARSSAPLCVPEMGLWESRERPAAPHRGRNLCRLLLSAFIGNRVEVERSC